VNIEFQRPEVIGQPLDFAFGNVLEFSEAQHHQSVENAVQHDHRAKPVAQRDPCKDHTQDQGVRDAGITVPRHMVGGGRQRGDEEVAPVCDTPGLRRFLPPAGDRPVLGGE